MLVTLSCIAEVKEGRMAGVRWSSLSLKGGPRQDPQWVRPGC